MTTDDARPIRALETEEAKQTIVLLGFYVDDRQLTTLFQCAPSIR